MPESDTPADTTQREYVDVEDIMSEHKCPRCGHETDEWEGLFCPGCDTGLIGPREHEWLASQPDYTNDKLRSRKVVL